VTGSESRPGAIQLERVCIVMLSTAGGAVRTLPVVNAIKRAHSTAHVTWLIQPGAAGLVDGHPAVDELIMFDRARGLGGFIEVRRQLESRRFDVVLVLQTYLKASIVSSFVRAPFKLGFDRARARDLSWLFTNRTVAPHPVQHAQDQLLEFAVALGLAIGPAEWNLGPWADERPWQKEFFAPFERHAVSMVVATSKPERDWLPERWAEVSDALWHDFGLEPVIVGGRSARELYAEAVILERARHKPRSALGSSLRELISILDGSAFAIAPDTGPLHMAVALERPVISLLGFSNPKRTGPYRRYHDLIVDAYGEPGENYPISMENRPGRMSRISVRDVLDRVERWKSSYNASSGPKG